MIQELTERFLRYVAVPTMSDEASDTCPSTEKQKDLGRMLARELLDMGLSDARMDENGYVYATLPANCSAMASVGFIAHMDTSPDAPDSPICPRVVQYTGGDLTLSDGIVMKSEDFPNLAECLGETLVVTDGKTLLGADDKAGIAIIMTAVARLIRENLPHGKVCIGFTPDEEIGRGADLFDVAAFGADYAYTVDGGGPNSLDYENFNAASAKVTLNGFGIHPGNAKDKMKNACLMAADFIALLPAEETPAHTEGREGFFHLTDMQGDVEQATLCYIIRDHSSERFEERKKQMLAAADALNAKWGAGSCEVTVTDSYLNMKEVVDRSPHVVERACCAIRALGMEPSITPIRGGTDGARLSFMGLPCPNLGTGAQNGHSRFEFASLTAMEQIVSLVVRICTDLTAEPNGKK